LPDNKQLLSSRIGYLPDGKLTISGRIEAGSDSERGRSGLDPALYVGSLHVTLHATCTSFWKIVEFEATMTFGVLTVNNNEALSGRIGYLPDSKFTISGRIGYLPDIKI